MPLPRKRFGQHFLCDQVIIARIIQVLAPQPSDHLVEIGPGQGALTLPLIKQHFSLDAIEIDHDCIAELMARTHHTPHLRIHAHDILSFDLALLHKSPLRVFGNLPYNISTPLLFHLLKSAALIHDMLFMLQKEVGERLAALPSTKAYGRLSVMMQYHCAITLLFTVPAHAFYPPPKVESSIIHLQPYQTLPHVAENYALFATIVREAFNQRRKTLRNSLQHFVSDTVWAALPLSPKARAEELSVADFVMIANAIHRVN